MNTSNKKDLSLKQRDELLAALKARFEKNPGRHPGLLWAKVQARLEASPDKLWSLAEMERTGGEPDVVGQSAHSFRGLATRVFQHESLPGNLQKTEVRAGH